jgi:hypothetical protein
MTNTTSTRYKDLDSGQQGMFAAKCRAFGIDPAKVPASVTTENGGKGLLLGHASGSATVTPSANITVANIRELANYGGVKDEEYLNGSASDAFVKYPAKLSTLSAPTLAACDGDVCKLKDSMSLEHHQAVNQAMQAYLLGNSTKVQEYEEHINALHFPMQMAVYAAQDIVITKDNPLIIDNPEGHPSSYVYGTVTVEEGGYILVKTPLSLDAQAFTTLNT